MDFLPKEIMYNDKTFKESNHNMKQALEILEKAQNYDKASNPNSKMLKKGSFNQNRNRSLDKEVTKEESCGGEGFWGNLLKNFKCGNGS